MHRCPYCKNELGQFRQSVIDDIIDRGSTAEIGCDHNKCNMNIIVIKSPGGANLCKDTRYENNG